MRCPFLYKGVFMQSVSDSILQEPIDFKIKVNRRTILHKLHILKDERTLKIYPLCLGTLLLIAKNLMTFKDLDIKDGAGVTFDTAVQSIIDNTKVLSRTISIAIWNRKFSTNRIVRWWEEIRINRLANFIESNLDSVELLTLSNVVIKQMEIEHFLASMGSMKGMEIAKDIVAPSPVESKKETSGKQ